MNLSIGVEDIEPGHWVAWVFEIPGCYASGRTRDSAIAGMPDAYTKETGFTQEVTCVVAEECRAVAAEDDPDFLINALFDDDRRPLTAQEVRDGVARLKAQRTDLLHLLSTINVAERHRVAEILVHVARAEQWYLRCVNIELDVPDTDIMGRLAFVREQLLLRLPSLVDIKLISDTGGERFSPRKLLRRAIWHERDHLQQIQHMLA